MTCYRCSSGRFLLAVLMSLHVGQRVIGTGWKMVNGHWLNWFLLLSVMYKGVMAPIRIEVGQREIHFIPGRNFTLPAHFTLDPTDISSGQKDTIYSGTWSIENGKKEIVECLKDKNNWKDSMKERRGNCKLESSSISFTLTSLIPEDAGDYDLELVSEAGEKETTLFGVKLYESVSKPNIQKNVEKIEEGINFTLMCQVEKGTNPQFTWEKLVNNGTPSILVKDTILTLTHINSTDCGSYKCVVKNEMSQEKALFNLSADDYPWCQKQNKDLPIFVTIGLIVGLLALICIIAGIWKFWRSNNERDLNAVDSVEQEEMEPLRDAVRSAGQLVSNEGPSEDHNMTATRALQ
ncbi:hepatic and glial cell adhesion molecule-like isoform X2 [Scyliorhinus torazame]|uniref:hepatic and glial cell adhesion molecule-like isoform X2 n=1 Tax=Scyliorhinus torazame TaxID=75743 RepID=UPI003B5AC6FF